MIQKYIEKLNENDIKKFALKNEIDLTNEEQKVILSTIKEEWETILYKDPSFVFKKVKPKLKETTYKKIVELYSFYKEKYQNYL